MHASIQRQAAGQGPEPAEQQASEALTQAKEEYVGAFQAMRLARHAVRVQEAKLTGSSPPVFMNSPTPEPAWMKSTLFVDLLDDDDE
ncbi:hypothetical protein HYH02_003083 [Chlamydomonas schloesseri]|uniref:Uncharacterized protein n=1 Tax=Chlamydomonas schloesseri TaxID=2026947 RepID=A0A836B9T1_9CHLO|nr:hypothetical protein HYH02_003083 [Chlamydomonas schloesseri]|eukprot:KAG2452047.1 hypothetical protein HYH02_003083 [Chlamydomonas schloesseri]